jgi:hypothetical protein
LPMTTTCHKTGIPNNSPEGIRGIF